MDSLAITVIEVCLSVLIGFLYGLTAVSLGWSSTTTTILAVAGVLVYEMLRLYWSSYIYHFKRES